MAERGPNGAVRRRGLVAGAAAVLAAALAKATERVARAAGDGSPLTMGNNDFTTNSPASQTTLQRVNGGAGTHVLRLHDQTGGRIDGVLRASADSSATSALLVTLSAQGLLNTGVSGNAATSGVSPLAGVLGTVNGGTTIALPTRTGVVALAQNDATGVGVYAEGVAYGVQGIATALGQGSGAGLGVLGQSQSGNGVYGASNSNVGVLGTSSASHALFGSSINGYGLYATSTNNAGVVASANSGVGCQGTSNGNVGVLGTPTPVSASSAPRPAAPASMAPGRVPATPRASTARSRSMAPSR